MRGTNRRRFLKGAGATGIAVGLTGCVGELESYLGGSDSPDDGNGNGTGNNSTQETDESTPTDDGQEGEVLVDFSNGVEDWYDLDSYGSFEAISEVRNGEQGIRLTAGEDEPYVGAVTAFSEPIDLRGKSLSVSFMAMSPQNHRLEVQPVAPDQGNLLRLNRTNTGPLGHWMNLDMGATGERGDPDLSEVYELRLIGRQRSQGQTIDMAIDQIRVLDAPDTGKVMLTWDDCHQSHARAFEIMEEFGFAGVDGVITHAVGASSRLDTGQLRQMNSSGWDIVSHPHPQGSGSAVLTEENWSESEQREIIENSKNWLETRGFEEGAQYYIAPGNTRDATNMELLREYHEASISYGGGNIGLPVTDPHTVGRVNGTNLDAIQRYIDLAEKYNQLVAPMWHSIGDSPEADITEADFRALLEYINSADVEVVTMSDLVG
ncbi:twin-arginine translocation signal domain-containing protein [Natronomonas salina]|uniref:twin-arginine translocation signal domain-containing protein n=1 Tax=Natronomonas salina TaxID=1710540 RepID=UPI0015B38406|nr:twin-arginine translocation signal domain-containing protein [Natronomonas salina]QLD88663.1 twin-arginine translocation signal domain-containing protein [Natronomonas salina]